MYHFFSALDTSQIRTLDVRGNNSLGKSEFNLGKSETTWPGLHSSILDGEFPYLVEVKVDLPTNFGVWLGLIKEARAAGKLLHFNSMSFWVKEGTFVSLRGVPVVAERIAHFEALFRELGINFSIQERLPLWGNGSPFARRWPPITYNLIHNCHPNSYSNPSPYPYVIPLPLLILGPSPNPNSLPCYSTPLSRLPYFSFLPDTRHPRHRLDRCMGLASQIACWFVAQSA